MPPGEGTVATGRPFAQDGIGLDALRVLLRPDADGFADRVDRDEHAVVTPDGEQWRAAELSSWVHSLRGIANVGAEGLSPRSGPMLRRTPISPDFIPPMRPALVSAPPIGPGWMHEIKYDGWRVIVRRSRSGLALWSRPGRDWSDRFARIARGLLMLSADSFVLDGEAAILREDGRTNFFAMRGPNGDAVLIAFDLLELDGADLRGEPIEVRRVRLAELMNEPQDGLRFSVAFDGEGATVFRHACALGLEGIVSKRRGSKYRSGLTGDWRKCRRDGYAR